MYILAIHSDWTAYLDGILTGRTAYPPYAGETVVGTGGQAGNLSISSGHTLSDWSLLAYVTCHQMRKYFYICLFEYISMSFKIYFHAFQNIFL